jgi:hypothetical protein
MMVAHVRVARWRLLRSEEQEALLYVLDLARQWVSGGRALPVKLMLELNTFRGRVQRRIDYGLVVSAVQRAVDGGALLSEAPARGKQSAYEVAADELNMEPHTVRRMLRDYTRTLPRPATATRPARPPGTLDELPPAYKR